MGNCAGCACDEREMPKEINLRVITYFIFYKFTSPIHLQTS